MQQFVETLEIWFKSHQHKEVISNSAKPET